MFVHARVITYRKPELSDDLGKCINCDQTFSSEDTEKIHRCYIIAHLILPLCNCSRINRCRQCYLVYNVPIEDWDIKPSYWEHTYTAHLNR